MYQKNIGAIGEIKAMEFLEKKGYKILEKNFRKRVGEIDIIAFDPKYNEYVFVEVKTRKNLKFGYPEEGINNKKLQKIQKTAQLWLLNQKLKDPNYRIDIIGIMWDNEAPKIDHIQNI